MSTPTPRAQTRTVEVWDPFVRVFHWSLVACVLLNQFVLEAGDTAHAWSGYIASALVVARIVWGFVGTRHARLVPVSALIKVKICNQHLVTFSCSASKDSAVRIDNKARAIEVD